VSEISRQHATRQQRESSAGLSTQRIEAFSDGGFAIALTLFLYVLVPVFYLLPGRIDTYWTRGAEPT
jgi:hypothetical protein